MSVTAGSYLRDAIAQVIAVGGLSIRDVDGGAEPFLYSSGYKGPGYVMIKGLVSHPKLLDDMVHMLAHKVVEVFPGVQLVAGNATGGMIPAYILREKLSEGVTRRNPRFVYMRNTRKAGGHQEVITGLTDVRDKQCLVVEELVNFAQTTINSANALREAGATADFGACIMSYDHPKQRRDLSAANVQLISLFTLSDLLNVAEDREMFAPELIESYRTFLADPLAWMNERGIVPNPKGGTL